MAGAWPHVGSSSLFLLLRTNISGKLKTRNYSGQAAALSPDTRAAARVARVPTFNQHSGWAETKTYLSLIYSLKKMWP